MIDVVNQKAVIWGEGDLTNEGLGYEVTDIPAEHQERAKAALAELIDAVSNKDDVIAEMVLEEKPMDAVALKAAIRRLTCKIELVPVLCGSAFKKKACRCWWTPWWITSPARWTCPARKASRSARTTRSMSRRAISTSSARWRSNSGPIPTPASWCFSGSIPASSRRATPFTIPAPANASASAA